jgi:hypothetical protein
MKKKLNEEINYIILYIRSSGSGTVINYRFGSDFLSSYGSGSVSQKVTVPMVPVPVPQHCSGAPENGIVARFSEPVLWIRIGFSADPAQGFG